MSENIITPIAAIIITTKYHHQKKITILITITTTTITATKTTSQIYCLQKTNDVISWPRQNHFVTVIDQIFGKFWVVIVVIIFFVNFVIIVIGNC